MIIIVLYRLFVLVILGFPGWVGGEGGVCLQTSGHPLCSAMRVASMSTAGVACIPLTATYTEALGSFIFMLISVLSSNWGLFQYRNRLSSIGIVLLV